MTTPSRMKKYHDINNEEVIQSNEQLTEEVVDEVNATNEVEDTPQKLPRLVRYNRFLNWSIFIMICLIVIMFVIVFYF